MAMATVAILGTGRMGGAMAGTLTAAGFDVVLANRTRERAEAVARPLGAAVAPTPHQAVAAAEFVVSSLAEEDALRAVFEGPDGALGGLREGTVVLETSTVSPAVVRDLARPVRQAGADILDAPVSGSVPAVQKGELAFMVGGAATSVERARPVLDALGSRVFHLGELGSGAAMKLAVNAVVHGLNAALAEALVLAERAGIARDAAYEVIAGGAAGAPFVQYKRAAYLDPATPVAFALALVAKDLDLILGLGREVGAHLPTAEAAGTVCREAIGAGFADRDMAALAEYLRGVATQPGDL